MLAAHTAYDIAENGGDVAAAVRSSELVEVMAFMSRHSEIIMVFAQVGARLHLCLPPSGGCVSQGTAAARRPLPLPLRFSHSVTTSRPSRSSLCRPALSSPRSFRWRWPSETALSTRFSATTGLLPSQPPPPCASSSLSSDRRCPRTVSASTSPSSLVCSNLLPLIQPTRGKCLYGYCDAI
eukprot:SAG11_NODE_507_length_8879_cov_8.961048_9_plen_181_part_00